MENLRWTWESPSGELWDLTNGSGNVVLSTGLSGLSWNNFEHVWSSTNRLHRGVKDSNLELDLKVDIGWNLLGQERYEARRRWWRASSPYEWGTLTCIHPNRETRQAQFRLRESPKTVFDHDPGTGYADDSVEVWPLVSDDAWWHGPWISVKKNSTNDKGLYPAANPIFNVGGDAWPVQVASDLPTGFTSHGTGTSSYFMLENMGDGPLYPVFELNYSYSGVEFGLQDASTNKKFVSEFNRPYKAEEKVTVYTDTREPKLISALGNVTWPELTRVGFTAIPPGKKRRIVLAARSGTQSYSSIWTGKVWVRHPYAMPF